MHIHTIAFTLTAIFVIFGIKQWRYRPAGPWNLGLVFGLFAFTLRAMLFDVAPTVSMVFNSVEYLIPIFFMICIRVNFDDDFVLGKVEKSALIIVAVLAVLFALRDVIGTTLFMYRVQAGIQFTIDALAVIWAYWSVIQTWSADLDAKRRKARVFFVAGVGPIVALVIALYCYSLTQPINFALHVDLVVSASIILLGGFGLIYFVDISPAVFGGIVKEHRAHTTDIPQEKTKTLNPAPEEKTESQQHLNQLEQVMINQARFKEMGLNLPGLAEYVQMPEYRLRALINQDLGYRNFNAYLNHYRVEHARQLLKDQNNTTSILEISMECGYKTLSTFNKAFKDITSVTPSEYRKKHQQRT